MHVLIVEDDAALGHFLGNGLRLDGHAVAVVTDGEAALDYAEQRHPELMILDLGLPRKDGMEVLAEMSERCGSTSVLVLTGRSEMEERVRCLELGADDVVLKPFSFHELRARCRVLRRRRGHFEDPVLRFGDLEMDRTARRVLQAGREVELTATEFSLLESLLRRGGERVASRAELLYEVWQMPAGAEAHQPRPHSAGTNIVEVYINYLRKKLRPLDAMERSGRSVINTVRGEGYVLRAAVRAPAPGSPAAGSPEAGSRAIANAPGTCGPVQAPSHPSLIEETTGA